MGLYNAAGAKGFAGKGATADPGQQQPAWETTRPAPGAGCERGVGANQEMRQGAHSAAQFLKRHGPTCAVVALPIVAVAGAVAVVLSESPRAAMVVLIVVALLAVLSAIAGAFSD